MKKLILDNFSYALLPKSATRFIAGGASCQVIDCHGQTCTVSNGGRTECCGNRTGNECYNKPLVAQTPSGGLGYSAEMGGGYN
jgi:hypothetical protein